MDDRVIKDYLYELLGCDELSTEEQIITEYKIKAKSLHPDKNSGDKKTTEEFIRLSKAKDVLCDKEKRKDYDTWRHSGLDISYETWIETVKSNYMSFHWAPEPKKEKMLESSSKEYENNQGNTDGSSGNTLSSNIAPQRTTKPAERWDRKNSWNNTKLKQFRNYMI